MLTKVVCLVHDNSKPYMVNVTKFGWDVLNNLRISLTCRFQTTHFPEGSHLWETVFNKRRSEGSGAEWRTE